ncbi:MAG: hypothetical protein WCI27_01205 [Candidatus Omnitrophota bacterium]
MNIGLWISRLGLAMIFFYCIGVSFFFSDFAEMHMTFSFLPFPVFIGEIILFSCILLLLGLSRWQKYLGFRTLLLLALYFGWVLLKALINYVHDGPLTCRNAALFYYPAFSVLAYCFYRGAGVPRNVWVFLSLLGAGILFFKGMVFWYWWTYLMFFAVALLDIKSDLGRRAGWLFFIVILVLGSEYLYKGPRAHFVSVFFSIIFLVFSLGRLFIRRNFLLYGAGLLAAFGVFMAGFTIFADKAAIVSLTSLNGNIAVYREKDRLYREKEASFVARDIAPHLYQPNDPAVLPSTPVDSQPAVVPLVTSKTEALVKPPAGIAPLAGSRVQAPVTPEVKHALVQENKGSPVMHQTVDMLRQVSASRVRETRELSLHESNIVFRLFVWRDMARELIHEKAWFGFSFGKPQRSRSLEVLGWARGEWGRDGWITPHNSYFHIIYRAGILGFVFIIILFSVVSGLVRDFMSRRSLTGILLAGALMYWLVLSNFFVILELPYNAILIWSLLGITCAYRDNLKAVAG